MREGEEGEEVSGGRRSSEGKDCNAEGGEGEGEGEEGAAASTPLASHREYPRCILILPAL